jgi:predicted metal-dependent peptidase
LEAPKKKAITKGIHQTLSHSIEEMMMNPKTYYPYYAEMCASINFYDTESIPTCGVRFTHSSMQFFWNGGFLEKMSQKEVNFVMVHELFHLLFSHYRRTLNGGYDPRMSNYAQDMIINAIIQEDITTEFVELPKGEVAPILLPEEYDGERVFEILYEWLKDKKQDYDEWKEKKQEEQEQQQGQDQGDDDGQGGQDQEEGDGDQEGQDGDQDGDQEGDGEGQGEGDPQGQGGQGGKESGVGNPFNIPPYDDSCPVSQDLKNIFDNMDMEKAFDFHFDDSDVPDNVKKQMVEDMINGIRARGLATGNFEDTIGKLRKSKKNYLTQLKRMIAFIKGKVKEKSWRRENRRGLKNFKGKVKHSNMINCVLDTSGSMHGYFDKIISYIFHDGYSINLIQCDAEVQGSTVVKNKNELNEMKIEGLGGTILQPGLDYIKENNLQKYSTVVLTDGYCDELDFTGLAKAIIISCGEKPSYIGNAQCVVIEE